MCTPRNSSSIQACPLTDPFVYPSCLANAEAQCEHFKGVCIFFYEDQRTKDIKYNRGFMVIYRK